MWERERERSLYNFPVVKQTISCLHRGKFKFFLIKGSTAWESLNSYLSNKQASVHACSRWRSPWWSNCMSYAVQSDWQWLPVAGGGITGAIILFCWSAGIDWSRPLRSMRSADRSRGRFSGSSFATSAIVAALGLCCNARFDKLLMQPCILYWSPVGRRIFPAAATCWSLSNLLFLVTLESSELWRRPCSRSSLSIDTDDEKLQDVPGIELDVVAELHEFALVAPILLRSSLASPRRRPPPQQQHALVDALALTLYLARH